MCGIIKSRLFLLVTFMFFHQTYGIHVAELSIDGIYTIDSYLNHTEGIGPNDLTDFSLCLRYNINYLRPIINTMVSYSTWWSDNSLLLIFIKQSDGSLMLRGCKCGYCSIEQGCASLKMNSSMIHQNWHHICLIQEAHIIGYEKINVTTKLYFDGFESGKDEFTIEKEAYQPLPAGGSFILGQEHDGKPILSDGTSFNPVFDKKQGMSGLLTQVELWNIVLTPSEVQKLARCEVSTLKQNSLVISWESTAWLARQSNFKDILLKDLCNKNVITGNFIWPRYIDFNTFNTYCSTIDGIMPTVSKKDEFVNEYKKIKNVFKIFNVTFPSAFVDNTKEDKIQCLNGQSVWSGMQRNPDNDNWYHHRTLANLSEIGIKATLEDTNCVDFNLYGFTTILCTKVWPCGICTIPEDKILYLKGLCTHQYEEYYDKEFYIYGLKNNRPYFRGIGKSHIFFECKENHTCSSGKWVLQSILHPNMTLEFNGKIPIGSHYWEFKSDGTFCNEKSGHKAKLTFSQCYLDKFTCKSGHCIPLDYRCNFELNCKDHSDERSCQKIQITEDYVKEMLPVSETREPCIVYINVSINSYPEISTKNVKFTADFYLNLRWKDLRLTFYDLDHDIVRNRMSQMDLEQVWQPNLMFKNALGPQNPVGSITGTLIRETEPLQEDIFIKEETYEFPGRHNSILTTQRYFQQFACHFDLVYYPFDNQVCMMEFQIEGLTENWLIFKKEGRGVEFQDSRKYEQYIIMAEVINTISVNNVSCAQVKIAFKRRIEYHLTNTFSQTLLIVLIGFFTFFFDVENFSDRALVVLTTMLVIATITSSIQQDLPKTSYYKLIDWWLLICFNLLVFTLAFHTYLSHIIRKSRNDAPILDGSTIIKVKPIHVNGRELHFESQELFKHGVWLNMIGKTIFIIFLVLFNILFWSIALFEHLKSAEDILSSHH